jgi:hypothetical protein
VADVPSGPSWTPPLLFELKKIINEFDAICILVSPDLIILILSSFLQLIQCCQNSRCFFVIGAVYNEEISNLCSSDIILPLYWRYNPVWFFRVGVIIFTFNPQPAGPGTTLRMAPFDLFGMGGPTRSLRFRQHRSPGHLGAQTSTRRR